MSGDKSDVKELLEEQLGMTGEKKSRQVRRARGIKGTKRPALKNMLRSRASWEKEEAIVQARKYWKAADIG